jgi:hypothetical protein
MKGLIQVIKHLNWSIAISTSIPGQKQSNHELLPPRGKNIPLRSLPPTQKCCAALHKTSAGERHKKRIQHQNTSEIMPPHTSALHPRTRPSPAHHPGASCAHPHISSLQVLTRATRSTVLCPIWVCISSSLAHIGYITTKIAAFLALFPCLFLIFSTSSS